MDFCPVDHVSLGTLITERGRLLRWVLGLGVLFGVLSLWYFGAVTRLGGDPRPPPPSATPKAPLPPASPWTPELSQKVDLGAELDYWRAQWKRVEVDPGAAAQLEAELATVDPALLPEVYQSLFETFAKTSDRRWVRLLRVHPKELRGHILKRLETDPAQAIRWIERFLTRPRAKAQENFRLPEVRRAVLELAQRPSDPELAIERGPLRLKALHWILEFKIREGIPSLVEAAGEGRDAEGKPQAPDPFGPVADYARLQLERFRARRSRPPRRSQAKRRR